MESQRLSGVTFVRQVRRLHHHVPRIARGANATSFAGIGDKVVVSTIVTPRRGKSMR